ncbi:MAG TPA: hypothetical protein PLL75_05755 [Candidatus Omnitrophota bacterium]|nr:hypothetical protein [Candidatus Omnitrophota bacterium]HPS37212.1 hypothetical protein [Candidatus Omnitrophota bacterium]
MKSPCRLRFFRKSSVFIAAVFLLSALNVPAFAEDLTRETENVGMQTRATKQISRVAAKSEAKEQTDKYKTGVTYEDILKDPDNIELNYRYAQDQIARGELLSAAATLERILLVNPNLSDVRLLYTVVLFRLDNLTEAKKELNILQTVKLPPKIKRQVDDFEKRIKAKQRRTHIGVRETLGWGYDTNRNASPSSKQQLVSNVIQDVTGSNTQKRDTNFLNVSSLDITHELGYQAGHTVFANFTYFLQNQTTVNSLDLGSYQYEVGGTYKNKYVNFTPSFYSSYMYLSSESFLRTQGGSFAFDHDFTKKLNAFYTFRVERQDYMNISESPNSQDRKGPQFDNFWGANYMITPTMRWSSNVGFSEKLAKQDFDAYSRVSLNNTHTWVWPKGQFVINAFNVLFDNYQAPDFTVANKIRHDRIFRYRTTYGVPLETILIGKVLPKPFKDIVFTFSYEFYRALSSVTNYTYTDNKIQTLFTKRMEF